MSKGSYIAECIRYTASIYKSPTYCARARYYLRHQRYPYVLYHGFLDIVVVQRLRRLEVPCGKTRFKDGTLNRCSGVTCFTWILVEDMTRRPLGCLVLLKGVVRGGI